jgi:hypothetical protein
MAGAERDMPYELPTKDDITYTFIPDFFCERTYIHTLSWDLERRQNLFFFFFFHPWNGIGVYKARKRCGRHGLTGY